MHPVGRVISESVSLPIELFIRFLVALFATRCVLLSSLSLSIAHTPTECSVPQVLVYIGL